MLDRLPLPRPILDQEENHLDRKEKATGRERNFLASLDQTRKIGRPVPQPVEPVGLSLDRLSLFGPENLFFLIPLFSNT